LAEPVACCLRGMDLAGVTSGDKVVIFGAGPMGAIMLQLARLRGAAQVIVVDPKERRRERASKLGAAWVLDPARDRPVEAIRAEFPDGIEVVFDCSGVRVPAMRCQKTWSPPRQWMYTTRSREPKWKFRLRNMTAAISMRYAMARRITKSTREPAIRVPANHS
jgi:threonine dehydrogenase-like Zn-dependent dehydrogenase